MTTISTDYLKQQQALHENVEYGKASISYAPLVVNILKKTGYRSVADYGAGKCRLKDVLSKHIKNFQYFPYDPAFPEYGHPTAADLVVCIDVLEHIESDYLSNVLLELKRMTQQVGLFTVHTGPAKKILLDGRNAHLIQKPASWWLAQLIHHFNIIQLVPVKRGFWVLVEAQGTNHSSTFSNKKIQFSLLDRITHPLNIRKL